MNVFRRFIKGILLKGETADPGDNLEGSLWHNSTDNKLKGYLDSAVRAVVTEDQIQTLTNKTIGDDLVIEGTTSSTDKDTGALVVEGGVGIEENLNVGGNVTVVGDLTVQGTTTAIDTVNLEVEDKNILINKGGDDTSAQGAGLTVERAGTDGSLVYDSAATSKFKVGDLGSEVEIADISSIQTLTNKSIDGDDNTITDLGTSALKDDAVTGQKFRLANDESLRARNFADSADINILKVDTADQLLLQTDLLPSGALINLGSAGDDYNSVFTKTVECNDDDLSLNSGGDILISANGGAGVVDVGNSKIVNLQDPTSPQDAATKDYVDTATAAPTPFTLANNQSSPANVTDFLVDFNDNSFFKTEYSIARVYGGAVGGTVDTAFASNAIDSTKFNGVVESIEVQLDGKILVGGTFNNYAGTSGRDYLIRLNSDGTLDTSFCTNAVDSSKFGVGVYSIKTQSDGKILVGGTFTDYAGTTGRSRLIRLNSDGTLDTSFCTNAVDSSKFSSGVYAIKVQSDGKILVGGTFTDYAGTSGRSYLIRLNSDGTLDTSFCTNAVDSSKFNNSIEFIQVQSDNKILVGGTFIDYAGTSGRDRLVRLNSDGTLDTSFCTNAVDSSKFSNLVYAIQVQSDNKILVGGTFIDYAGTSGRDRLVRLNSDGTLDTSFCTNAVDSSKFSFGVYAIQVQSNSKILVGGAFTNYAGTSGRDNLVRLNSDGTLDTSFCANAADSSKFSGILQSIELQSDGKILVGGSFINYAGTSGRNRLIRLDGDGPDTELLTQGSFSGIYRPSLSAWELGGFVSVGDASDVIFSITTGGQLQYTTSNLSGTEVESVLKYSLKLL